MQWENPSAVGKSAHRMTGKAAGAKVVTALVRATSAFGVAGFFYATSAPEATYAKSVETFTRILKSFRIQGAPAKPEEKKGVPLLQFVKWEDPNEKTFSDDVPKGWKVSGGMFRFALVDTRVELVVTSPDDKITISLRRQGDATFYRA